MTRLSWCFATLVRWGKYLVSCLLPCRSCRHTEVSGATSARCPGSGWGLQGGTWSWGGLWGYTGGKRGRGRQLAVGTKGLNRMCICVCVYVCARQGLGACPLSLLMSLLAPHCDPPPLYNLHPCAPAAPGVRSGIPLSLQHLEWGNLVHAARRTHEATSTGGVPISIQCQVCSASLSSESPCA